MALATPDYPHAPAWIDQLAHGWCRLGDVRQLRELASVPDGI